MRLCLYSLRKATVGAVLFEYIILITVIAIAMVNVVTSFTQDISQIYDGSTTRLEEARDGTLVAPSQSSGGDGTSGGGGSVISTAFQLRYDTIGSGSSVVHLPLFGTVNIAIDWGVGALGCPSTVTVSGEISCTYASEGIHTIKITGSLSGFGNTLLVSPTSAADLLAVDNWGSVGLVDLSSAFSGASKLAYLPPNLPSTVTAMNGTFKDGTYNGTHIKTWDTSGVTSMFYIFANNPVFNQDISSWDVSSVAGFQGAFSDAIAFNQPIGSWDVSGANSLSAMFQRAVSFNQDLPWNTVGVVSVSYMFDGATVFDGNIAGWPVGSVEDYSYMFRDASNFNKPIGSWSTAAADFMSGTFKGAAAFDQPIGAWDVSGVIDMEAMFMGASVFDQDITGWNTVTVENMNFMFSGAALFNRDLSGWCVPGVPSKPYDFDAGSLSWAGDPGTRPVWGTCP